MSVWLGKLLLDVKEGRQVHYLKSVGRLFILPFLWAMILYMRNFTTTGFFGVMGILWLLNLGLSLYGMRAALPQAKLVKHFALGILLVLGLCLMISFVLLNFGPFVAGIAGVLIYLGWLVVSYGSWEQIRRNLEEGEKGKQKGPRKGTLKSKTSTGRK